MLKKVVLIGVVISLFVVIGVDGTKRIANNQFTQRRQVWIVAVDQSDSLLAYSNDINERCSEEERKKKIREINARRKEKELKDIKDVFLVQGTQWL